MTETLADPEGMREDAIKHPSLIPSVRRSSWGRECFGGDGEAGADRRQPGHGDGGAGESVAMTSVRASERERGEWTGSV
jgi:hypothetical protein